MEAVGASEAQSLAAAQKTIREIMRIIDDLSSVTKSDSEQPVTLDYELPASADINSFILTKRQATELVPAKELELSKSPYKLADIFKGDTNTFMLQNVRNPVIRKRVGEERVMISEEYRGQGNEAYRLGDYNKAIVLYTRAIEHLKDNPILYNNRGLCFMQLKLYNRALIDFEYVIRKLTRKNIDTWMFRAATYYRMGDYHNFERTLRTAKQYNVRHSDYVDDCAKKLRLGMA